MEKENEIIVTRIFNAPAKLIFETWTNPEHIKKWWAPASYTTTFCTVDLKVGGLFRYCMTSAEGIDYWGKGIYKIITPYTNLVYSDSFTDKDGNAVPASYYGMQSDVIQEALVEITFEQIELSTKVTIKYSNVVEIGQEREMAMQGWNDLLDKLSTHLLTLIK